uniref:Uncharacterized protein n=1 Tax=viral metagenome TaxID=1070528 RepID=A0A6M3JR36_9ZZZZ
MKKIFALLSIIWILSFPISGYAGSNATSSITVQTIVNRVRADLNAATDAFWTPADIIQWTNEAVEVSVILTRGMEASEDITLVEDTISYTISASHYDISHAIYDSGVTGSPRRFSVLTRFIPTNAVPQQQPNPVFWWEWENKFYVFPAPDSNIAGATITIYLISNPTTLTAVGDAIPTPAYLDTAIIYYVKSKAYFKERSEQKATFYLKLFHQLINDYRQDIIRFDNPVPVKEGQ